MHLYYDLVCGLDVSQYLAKIIQHNELRQLTEEDKKILKRVKLEDIAYKKDNVYTSTQTIMKHVMKFKGDIKEAQKEELTDH